jgi:hypothetical protein
MNSLTKTALVGGGVYTKNATPARKELSWTRHDSAVTRSIAR